MGERREFSIISHRRMTKNDLKQERSFFRGSVSTFLQLVAAQLVRALHRHRRGHGSNPRKPEFFRSRLVAHLTVMIFLHLLLHPSVQINYMEFINSDKFRQIRA